MLKFNMTLALLLSVMAVSAQAVPRYYRGDLIHSTQSYVRVGGDRVKFGYKVAGACDVDSLKATALTIKTNSTTDRWDDQWYAFSVAQGRCLVMGWYDLDAGKYGWAAIQNQPNSWAVRSNSRGWETLANDAQKKYSFTVNGQKVDLDIFNPKNEGALTGNDILISFGY